MAEYLAIAVVALSASALTLFSGFGLGTLLMPALALLFPVPLAIAATAVVHLLNNLFKFTLVGRHANLAVVLRFGMPAAFGAIAGSLLLLKLSVLPALGHYDLLGRQVTVESIELLVGLLIIAFAVLEISPRTERLEFPSRYLPAGGLASGFFGGLSGNQGALRAAFLVRAGLGKESFVGTSVACSLIVDTLRIAVYGSAFIAAGGLLADNPSLLSTTAVAVVAAFTGAFIGVRLLNKVTLRFVQLTVAVMMGLVGLGLASGLL